MSLFKRFSILLLIVLPFLFSSASAAQNKSGYSAREITTEVVQEIPEEIHTLLDLAYQQWMEVDAADLKEKNKFTEWRNQYKFGWCGGFITWCMLEAGIPQKEKSKIKKNETVEGLFHIKEAGVGKLYDGYAKLDRITRVPQKGFIVVFGTGKFRNTGATPYYHVGLVYDVEKLEEGKYRLTTIEGNVTTPGDETHKKNGHTVRMFVRDYILPQTGDKKEKENDLILVPEAERSQEENALFSYQYTYDNPSEYITIFLMPWIPENSEE